jgi:hypothetical protein
VFGHFTLECLLDGEQSSPARISRQGFASKSLQSGPNFKVELLWPILTQDRGSYRTQEFPYGIKNFLCGGSCGKHVNDTK